MRLVLLMACLVSALAGQQPDQSEPPWRAQIDRLALEQMIRDGRQQDAALAKKRAEEQARREFISKARAFAEAWKDLFSEYSEKGTFNVKKAKAVNRAFRNLQRSGNWPQD